MSRLALQITRPCFVDILEGRQTVESRYVYPRNAKKYVDEIEHPDGSVEVKPKHYDMLWLINGHRKDAPRLEVEVVSEEFIILTDEDGNDLTFEENGVEYLASMVEYHLGKILSTENCDRLLNV